VVLIFLKVSLQDISGLGIGRVSLPCGIDFFRKFSYKSNNTDISGLGADLTSVPGGLAPTPLGDVLTWCRPAQLWLCF
jgi:hypothetical protein